MGENRRCKSPEKERIADRLLVCLTYIAPFHRFLFFCDGTLV
jgi:hypothetical protein